MGRSRRNRQRLRSWAERTRVCDRDSENLPTDRLPTIATFLDFEGAITPMGR